MAGKYPQEKNAAVACDIQPVRIFLQRMTKDMGQEFEGLEKVMQETFLPRLYFVKSKTLPSVVISLITLLVNKSRLVLQNPVTSSEENYTSSLCASCDLVGGVTGGR